MCKALWPFSTCTRGWQKLVPGRRLHRLIRRQRGAVQGRSPAPVSMGIAASVGRDSQAAAVCPSWATGHRPEGEPDAKRAPGSGRGDLLGVSPYLAQMSVVPFSRPKTLGFSSFSYNDVQCFTILKMKAQFISLRNT